MTNLLDRLINQLDSLLPFIGTSDENVFNFIHKNEKIIWTPTEISKYFPDKYETYRKQINHSALVLGYSYFEAFLSDLACQIFRKRPTMLPNEKTLKCSEIVNAGDYKKVLQILIDKEIYGLFYKDINDILKYYCEKLNLEITSDGFKKLQEASYLRNCIIHNLGIANSKLSQFDGYKENEPFELSFSEVHSFGIVAREEANMIWQQACKKHLENV